MNVSRAHSRMAALLETQLNFTPAFHCQAKGKIRLLIQKLEGECVRSPRANTKQQGTLLRSIFRACSGQTSFCLWPGIGMCGQNAAWNEHAGPSRPWRRKIMGENL